MIRKGMLARLAVPMLVATMMEPLMAEEPVGTAPPATSIAEWKTATVAAPTASAGEPVGPTPPAKSIREWRTAPVAATPVNCPTTPVATPVATQTASPAAKPSVGAAAPQIPITISITSSLREGSLVVILDDVPIFNEKFQKPVLFISRTTTWDPLQVAAGDPRLSAKVYGSKKTYFSKLYDLHVGRTGRALHFVMQGDKLTIDSAS